jgi:transcriptional regulator with XRE-family HTH domain
MRRRRADEKRPRRSRGAQALANVVASGVDRVEIARVCGSNASSITRWLSGERKPTLETQALLKRRYKIPLSQWAEPELELGAALAPVEDPEAVATVSVRERAEKLQRIADQAVKAVESPTSTADDRRLALEKLRAVRIAQGSLNQLGKITGETKDLTEAQIVKTPAWSRVCTELLKALTPWPEAMLAVGHALRAFDLEGR